MVKICPDSNLDKCEVSSRNIKYTLSSHKINRLLLDFTQVIIDAGILVELPLRFWVDINRAECVLKLNGKINTQEIKWKKFWNIKTGI